MNALTLPIATAPMAVPAPMTARLSLAETVVGVLIALQFPPGLLGQCAMPLQLALAAAGICYLAIRSGGGLQAISLEPVRWMTLVVLYLFAAHLAVEAETATVAFVDLIVAGAGLAFVGTLLTVARPRDLLVALVLIHAALAASDLILISARSAGLDQALRLATFPLKTYTYAVQWNVPFGFAYDQPVPVGSMLLPRAIGIYREPGVYQAFALTACAAALLLRDLPWRRTLATIILLGSACSLSTAWLASLVAMSAWAVVVRTDRRSAASFAAMAILLTALAAGMVAGMMIPGLGFNDKLAGESGQDRLRAFSAIAPALTASPWLGLGQGTLRGQDVIESVSGSLVVGIARLGIIGTLIFLGATAATVSGRHDRRSLVSLVPLGVTMLSSQPLYYSIAAYFIMALPWREALAPPPRPRPQPRAKPMAPLVVPAEEIEELVPDDQLLGDEDLVIVDDALDEEDEALVPLVLEDDELDEECEDEGIIPMVLEDEADEDEDLVPLVLEDEQPEPAGAGR